MIDCPPSLGILTLNALVTSTDIIVPVQVHYYALEGLRRLLETVGIIRQRFHPCSMENIGLLLTFVEERTTFSRQVQQQLRELFGDLVFDTVIHRNIRLAEAPSAGEPVLSYAPQSKAAADYRALAAEILERVRWPPSPPEDRMKRGIQKQLGTIFEGVWIPKRQRPHNLHRSRSPWLHRVHIDRPRPRPACTGSACGPARASSDGFHRGRQIFFPCLEFPRTHGYT